MMMVMVLVMKCVVSRVSVVKLLVIRILGV